RPLADIFTGYDEGLLALTLRGFLIFSFSFLFSGFAIFGSAFFTALNDGLTSALISFLRTLVFQTAAVIVLPLIWGIDGVWVSSAAAELTAAVITVAFIFAKRKKYRYL
ncbi:MAG: MATE family efflux transporter, partial [Oscillospiraceae bacterium]|nr:MATE family efflux transporter [Oscillospiraceae bacterium]